MVVVEHRTFDVERVPKYNPSITEFFDLKMLQCIKTDRTFNVTFLCSGNTDVAYSWLLAQMKKHDGKYAATARGIKVKV